ncbi:MAG: hypothetical protein P4L51_24590 [Puia sp.]|nr:hypothetical protein [Puia sp.]
MNVANETGEQPVHVLVIGKDPAILQTVLRLLNDFKKARYHAVGTTEPEQARELFSNMPVDLVLITNGLDRVTDASLREWLVQRRPGIPILQHYGGGSGLLFNEITYFLSHRKS